MAAMSPHRQMGIKTKHERLQIISMSTTVKISYRQGSTFSVTFYQSFIWRSIRMTALNQINTYNNADVLSIFPVRCITPKICIIVNLSDQANQSNCILNLCLCLHPIRDPGIKMFFCHR